MIFPPLLQKGDAVLLVSPSSPLTEQQPVADIAWAVERLGYRVRIGASRREGTARGYAAAFREVQLDELSVPPAGDQHVAGRLHRAETIEEIGHVLGQRRGHAHGRRIGRHAGAARPGRKKETVDRQQDGAKKDKADQSAPCGKFHTACSGCPLGKRTVKTASLSATFSCRILQPICSQARNASDSPSPLPTGVGAPR